VTGGSFGPDVRVVLHDVLHDSRSRVRDAVSLENGFRRSQGFLVGLGNHDAERLKGFGDQVGRERSHDRVDVLGQTPDRDPLLLQDGVIDLRGRLIGRLTQSLLETRLLLLDLDARH
jgi:hypothetical protein